MLKHTYIAALLLSTISISCWTSRYSSHTNYSPTAKNFAQEVAHAVLNPVPNPTAYCHNLWPNIIKDLITRYNALVVMVDDVRVWIDEKTLQHIFKGELYPNGRLGGLHHDPGGFLRKEGKLRNIKELSGGYYTAEVWDGTKWLPQPKTFFPENISQEEVIGIIYDSLSSNSSTTMIDETGRKIVQTHLTNNMYIKSVIEANGRIVSAYPFEHIKKWA